MRPSRRRARHRTRPGHYIIRFLFSFPASIAGFRASYPKAKTDLAFGPLSVFLCLVAAAVWPLIAVFGILALLCQSMCGECATCGGVGCCGGERKKGNANA